MRGATGVAGACLALLLALAAPAHAAEARALRIALVSDPHVTLDSEKSEYRANFHRVIDEVNAAGVDAVIVTGDLTDEGTEEQFRAFKALAARFKSKACFVPGNHDVGIKPLAGKPATMTAERLALYEAIIGPSFCADEIAPGIRVVAINASLLGSGNAREAEQWAFLESQLTSPAEGTTLLISHYPLFVERPDEADEYFNINTEPRRQLWQLLQRGGVKGVLSGHLHRPIEHESGGIQMIGAPAVSFGLPRGRQGVGWRLLSLLPDGRIVSELKYLAPVPSAATQPTTAPKGGQAKAPLASLGSLAVLPMADPDNYVFEYLRTRGLTDGNGLKILKPQELIERSAFNATRYKACLYLSGETYLRTVDDFADGDRAIREFCAAGGILIVLPSEPYPFYRDERDGEVINGAHFGLTFLGNEEQEGSARGFDDAPAGPLAFEVTDEAFGRALGGQASLAFPGDGEQRWRPLIRTNPEQPYASWVRLVDSNGQSLGDAAAFTSKRLSDRRRANVAYASYVLTQRHPMREKVLDAVFMAVSQKAQAPARDSGAPHDGPATTVPTTAPSAAADVSDRVHAIVANP